MKINELEPNSKVEALSGTLEILGKMEDRGATKVQEGVLKDDTGQVKIVFWNDGCNKFKEGDKLIIQTGWCKEYEGKLQVSGGKFGKILKVPDKIPGQ